MLKVLFMQSVSISPGGFLCNLDGNRPVGVSLPFAASRLEVQFLQAPGDGSDLPVPDGPAVHLDDGRYLESCSGEKHLVRRVKLRPIHVSLGGQHPELLLRELYDSISCDPLQDVCRYGRRNEPALAHEKDV